MTREEALQRIQELETELEGIKGVIRARNARTIPAESVVKHPWLSALWDHSELFRNSVSNVIRLACFGELKLVSHTTPWNGQIWEYHKYESLKIKELNQEQYDKYKEVFEKVISVIEPYITGGKV